MAAPLLQERPDQRLVQVALQILAEEGLEALTLRRIARRAGLSHGAPLRHFSSFAALRSEVAAHGFRRLSAAVERAGGELPIGAGALARLAAAGRAYVEAAVASPGLFALMFRPDQLDPTHPAFRGDSRDAFEQLVRHVRAAQEAGWQADRETRVLAGSVWAAVHGLATLWAQGALTAAVPGASLDGALATTLELVLGDRPPRPAGRTRTRPLGRTGKQGATS
jgi:AcrR family transcriptional regulator